MSLARIDLICYSPLKKTPFVRSQMDMAKSCSPQIVCPRRCVMPKKMPESFNYLSNNPEFVPDPEIEEFMEEEIAHAPKDPDLLAQRLRNTAASPQDAG